MYIFVCVYVYVYHSVHHVQQLRNTLVIVKLPKMLSSELFMSQLTETSFLTGRIAYVSVRCWLFFSIGSPSRTRHAESSFGQRCVSTKRTPSYHPTCLCLSCIFILLAHGIISLFCVFGVAKDRYVKSRTNTEILACLLLWSNRELCSSMMLSRAAICALCMHETLVHIVNSWFVRTKIFGSYVSEILSLYARVRFGLHAQEMHVR